MSRLFEFKIANKGGNPLSKFASAFIPRKRQASITDRGFKLFTSKKKKMGRTGDRHFAANEADISMKVVSVRRFSRSESVAHVIIQPLDGKEALVMSTKNVEDAREFVSEFAALKAMAPKSQSSTPEATPPPSPQVTSSIPSNLETLPILSTLNMGLVVKNAAATALAPQSSLPASISEVPRGSLALVESECVADSIITTTTTNETIPASSKALGSLSATAINSVTTTTTVSPLVVPAEPSTAVATTLSPTVLHPLLVPLHTEIRQSPVLSLDHGWGIYILLFKLMVLQTALACWGLITSPLPVSDHLGQLWFWTSELLHSLLAAPFGLLQSVSDGLRFIFSTPIGAFPWREWKSAIVDAGTGDALGRRVPLAVIILHILTRILMVYGLHCLAISHVGRSLERFFSARHLFKGKGFALNFLTEGKLVLLGQLDLVLCGVWDSWMLLIAHRGMGLVTLGLTMWSIFILLKLWSFSTTADAHRRHKGETLEAITFSSYIYFLFAPTFIYQTSYPRTRSIDWEHVRSLVLQLVGVGLIVKVLAVEWMFPVLEAHVGHVTAHKYHLVLLGALRLAFPCAVAWLLSVGYGVFHLYTNLIAELTRFGDRTFYREWWNVNTLRDYWRLWNAPMSFFFKRHVLFPLYRLGEQGEIFLREHFCVRSASLSMRKNGPSDCVKMGSFTIIFLLSAFLHEIVMVVPFNTIQAYRGVCNLFGPWAFYGIAGQIGAILATDRLAKAEPYLGNAVFWTMFCIVGQPMAVLLYYHDMTSFTS
uniref:DGAT1 n=1 Tax=Nannochloropsis oceanica TaxID=145522 RepID=A0A221C9C9_9STRA|nr:DGAT1 [Nannochloropsis oceanica]